MRVAWHNAAYPDLLTWLSTYGGPLVASAVEARKNADRARATKTEAVPQQADLPSEPTEAIPTLPEHCVAQSSAAEFEASPEVETSYDLVKVLSSGTLGPQRRSVFVPEPAPVPATPPQEPTPAPQPPQASEQAEAAPADSAPQEPSQVDQAHRSRRPPASTATKAFAIITVSTALAAIIIGVVLLSL